MSLSIAPQSNTSDSLLTLRDAHPISPRSPQSWSGESPRTLTTEGQSKMQRFFGFANFYRRSIQGYSKNFAHGIYVIAHVYQVGFLVRPAKRCWPSDGRIQATASMRIAGCSCIFGFVASGNPSPKRSRDTHEPDQELARFQPQSPGKYPSSI